ncbi:MAG TPA: aminotransferase class V-fold PLP-dependent enzyme [Candidatus Poseidoniales archaeon]|nr:aminotransferase class V-fold PLP-dependent enzyme [Candidatus Poseidoniales archaeon]
MTDLVNFDGLATAEVNSEVIAAMQPWMSLNSSPNSLHPLGEATQNLYTRVRAKVAARVGCSPGEVIFTSGIAEADNLALKGFAKRHQSDEKSLAVLATEPLTTLNCAREIEKHGWGLATIPVDQGGVVDLALAKGTINSKTALVSSHLVNEETGAVQPISELVEAVREISPMVKIHCNGRAGIGRIPFSFADLGVDSLSLDTASIGGPSGIGVLIVKSGEVLAPLIHGAGADSRFDSTGISNAQIAGLGAACELPSLSASNSLLLANSIVKSELGRKCWTIGPENCAPGILNLCIESVLAEPFVIECGINGLLISPSSGCTSTAGKASHVLLAMGISESSALSSLRFSLSSDISGEEIGLGVAALAKSYADMSD